MALEQVALRVFAQLRAPSRARRACRPGPALPFLQPLQVSAQDAGPPGRRDAVVLAILVGAGLLFCRIRPGGHLVAGAALTPEVINYSWPSCWCG